MGLLGNLWSWVKGAVSRQRRDKPSQGERLMSGVLNGGGASSHFGTWTQDRHEQIRHYRGWQYIAIKAIGEQVGEMTPQVAEVLDARGMSPRKKALLQRRKQILGRRARTKAMTTGLQTHEELQPLDSDHPLVRLLRNPNKPDVSWTFWFKLLMYLELTGNTYIWAIPNGAGLPAELWVIPAHWVRPFSEMGSGELVSYYEIRPLGGLLGSGAALKVPADEIIAIAYPNPLHPVDGYSPQSAIAEWIDLGESIDASRWFAMKQGVNPSAVVTMDKDCQDPDPEQVKRFKSELRAKYQGEERTGEPIVLTPGVDAKPWSTAPSEMDYVNGADQNKDWILAGYRVGKSIAGIMEEVNFASAIAARANFMLSTIKPKLTLIGQVLTEKLAWRWDESYRVFWPDVSPDDPQQKLAEHTQYLQAGVLTPNEVRADLGREPIEGGDELQKQQQPQPPKAGGGFPGKEKPPEEGQNATQPGREQAEPPETGVGRPHLNGKPKQRA